MRTRIRAALVCAALTLGTGALVASDFRVHNDAMGDQRSGAVAAGEGEFLVAWLATEPTVSVRVQRFDAVTGGRLGGEVELRSFTGPASGSRVEVARLPGAYLVAWNAEAGIEAARLDDQGTISTPVPVSLGFQGSLSGPWLAVAPDGSYAISWWADSQMWIRIAEVGDDLGEALEQSIPGVGGDLLAFDQGYVLLTRDAAAFVDAKLWHQRVDRTGQALGPPLELFNAGSDGIARPRAARLADGSFLVVWSSAGAGIMAQRLDAGGSLLGDLVLLLPTDGPQPRSPTLAATPEGFLLVWVCELEMFDPERICGQVFGHDLQPAGPRRAPLDRAGFDERRSPELASAGANQLISWDAEEETGFDRDVYGSYWPLFADGFESGGTAGWSTAVGGL